MILFLSFCSALESKNFVVKKQVFELLSALCVYSTDGYARTLEAIDYYQVRPASNQSYKKTRQETRSFTTHILLLHTPNQFFEETISSSFQAIFRLGGIENFSRLTICFYKEHIGIFFISIHVFSMCMCQPFLNKRAINEVVGYSIKNYYAMKNT